MATLVDYTQVVGSASHLLLPGFLINFDKKSMREQIRLLVSYVVQWPFFSDVPWHG